MSDNPYEAPKAHQPLEPEKSDWIDRIGNWLRWSFRIGLLLVILSAFVRVRSEGTMDLFLSAVSIIGAALFTISIVGIIPLSLWGFIKGYREGRAR